MSQSDWMSVKSSMLNCSPHDHKMILEWQLCFLKSLPKSWVSGLTLTWEWWLDDNLGLLGPSWSWMTGGHWLIWPWWGSWEVEVWDSCYPNGLNLMGLGWIEWQIWRVDVGSSRRLGMDWEGIHDGSGWGVDRNLVSLGEGSNLLEEGFSDWMECLVMSSQLEPL